MNNIVRKRLGNYFTTFTLILTKLENACGFETYTERNLTPTVEFFQHSLEKYLVIELERNLLLRGTKTTRCSLILTGCQCYPGFQLGNFQDGVRDVCVFCLYAYKFPSRPGKQTDKHKIDVNPPGKTINSHN